MKVATVQTGAMAGEKRLKTKWAELEAVAGAGPRLKLIAQDIVSHFDRRIEAMDGKAMVVCMSGRICIDLYGELTRLCPDWHDENDDQGRIKIGMTGSASDPPDWQPHIRNKARREMLAKRFRDPNDPPSGGPRAGHVVDRLRRAESSHHVCGQADARPRADGGDRAGQPCLPGQAGVAWSSTTSGLHMNSNGLSRHTPTAGVRATPP